MPTRNNVRTEHLIRVKAFRKLPVVSEQKTKYLMFLYDEKIE